MASPGPVTRLISRLPPRARIAAGVGVLWLAAWASLYGNLWSFERHDASRFTARAMLTGTLRMRSAVSLAGQDEQIFNGGVYTNWGFGVPLLQAPFHALAGVLGIDGGFFPDRAIFFIYLVAFTPVLWVAVDRLLRAQPTWAQSNGARLAVSWTATWLVLVMTVYPFMAGRFAIYEETFGYFEICELLAIGGYVLAAQSERLVWVGAMAAAAGLGLLVRPTGLLHLGVLGATVLLGELRAPDLRTRARRVGVFVLASAPFVAFWLWSNRVRTGSPLGLGLNNSNPAWIYGTAPQRFGSLCLDSPLHTAEATLHMLQGFFLYVTPHAAPGTWLRRCHIDFEERDGTGEPFFGPVVLVLVAWRLWVHLRRRERRLAVYLPYGGLAAFFAAYVWTGSQFPWRYTGDFWPLIVLACVQAVQTSDPDADADANANHRLLTPRLASFLFWGGLVYFFRYLVPFQWSTRAETLDAAEVAALARDFDESRWGHDPPRPSRIECGAPPSGIFHDGLGWNADCSVFTFTNVFLGVPPRADGRYRVHLATSGFEAPRVRVYVNGRTYVAERHGDGYDADVTIPNADLHSPIVMATVEWVRSLDPPATGKLLSIDLS